MALSLLSFAYGWLDKCWIQQQTIPSVLNDAYLESSDPKPKNIVLWGVTIDPNGAKDAKASVILMKFLRARCVPLALIPSFITRASPPNY